MRGIVTSQKIRGSYDPPGRWKGTASVNNPDPARRQVCMAAGAPRGEHESRQAPTEPAGETNKPKDMRGQEVVAP